MKELEDTLVPEPAPWRQHAQECALEKIAELRREEQEDLRLDDLAASERLRDFAEMHLGALRERYRMQVEKLERESEEVCTNSNPRMPVFHASSVEDARCKELLEQRQQSLRDLATEVERQQLEEAAMVEIPNVAQRVAEATRQKRNLNLAEEWWRKFKKRRMDEFRQAGDVSEMARLQALP